MRRKRRKVTAIKMTKPAYGAGAEYAKQPEERTIQIRPYKHSRDILRYPVRKGQGVTINGWQFDVHTIQSNGKLVLRPLGQIMADPPPAEPTEEAKKEEHPDDKLDEDKKFQEP